MSLAWYWGNFNKEAELACMQVKDFVDFQL